MTVYTFDDVLGFSLFLINRVEFDAPEEDADQTEYVLDTLDNYTSLPSPLVIKSCIKIFKSGPKKDSKCEKPILTGFLHCKTHKPKERRSARSAALSLLPQSPSTSVRGGGGSGVCPGRFKNGNPCKSKLKPGLLHCKRHAPPEVELLEPEVELLEPEVELPEPEVELPEPEVELLEPEVELLEPEVELPEPEPVSGICPGRFKNGNPCKRKLKPGLAFCKSHTPVVEVATNDVWTRCEEADCVEEAVEDSEYCAIHPTTQQTPDSGEETEPYSSVDTDQDQSDFEDNVEDTRRAEADLDDLPPPSPTLSEIISTRTPSPPPPTDFEKLEEISLSNLISLKVSSGRVFYKFSDGYKMVGRFVPGCPDIKFVSDAVHKSIFDHHYAT
jgi:mRNA-degrading endonuclease RelE of RelBE toxin-antitoxin system